MVEINNIDSSNKPKSSNSQNNQNTTTSSNSRGRMDFIRKNIGNIVDRINPLKKTEEVTKDSIGGYSGENGTSSKSPTANSTTTNQKSSKKRHKRTTPSNATESIYNPEKREQSIKRPRRHSREKDNKNPNELSNLMKNVTLESETLPKLQTEVNRKDTAYEETRVKLKEGDKINLPEQEILQLKEENKRLKEGNKRHKDGNKRLKEENKHLKEENKNLKEEDKNLKEENKTLKEDIKRLKATSKRQEGDIKRGKNKIEDLLRKVAELRPSSEDIPIARIITGIYEDGGTNPRKIQDDWQLFHKTLRNLCFESFKQLKHRPEESTALKEYQKLTENPSETSRLPRIETTIVVRKVSILLMRTFGLLNLTGDADISSTIASKMPQGNDRISEDILRKIPPLDLEAPFDVVHALHILTQSSDYGQKCAEFWDSERRIIERSLEEYGIIPEIIHDIAGRLMYACIYIKLQMQSIGGADIAGYILGTAGDYLDFCTDNPELAGKYPNRLPFDEENFDDEFDTNCAEECTENSTALFTTFPGIAYRGSNGLKVISKCKIAT